MNTSEVLNRAADLIEERGWTRVRGWADSVGPDAPLCLEGAIQAVTNLRRTSCRFVGGGYVDEQPLANCPAYRAVQSYLETESNLWYWNDALGRDAGQVVEVLRACAVIEASREREAAGVSA